MRRLIGAMIILVLSFYPFSHLQADCRISTGEPVTIVSLADEGRFMLDDGRVLRLAGLEQPRDAAQQDAWRKLAADFFGVPVVLSFPDHQTDRYGRLTGFVRRVNGGDLQNVLLAAGQARVVPMRGMGECASDFLATEQSARDGQKGFWRLPEYAPLDALDLTALLAREGEFTLVEGVVAAVAERQGRLFYNFEEDWRRDFTMTVDRTDVRLFLEGVAGRSDEGAASLLVGKRIRVRGYLSRYNGPEISVTLPEQVEILSEAALGE